MVSLRKRTVRRSLSPASLAAGLAALASLLPAVAAGDPASRPTTRLLDTAQMQRLWAQMGGGGRAARDAVGALAAGGDDAVAFLRRQIEPVLRKANALGVRQMIAELDSDRYAVRERASRQIEMLGGWAAPRLREALRRPASVEARVRLKELIKACGVLPADTPPRRRIIGAARVLERIGTPKAKALLRLVASSGAQPYLKYMEVDRYAIEVGFVPDQAEYVWGEPIQYFSFVIRNVGDREFQCPEGGDYRGSGRHENYAITAVEAGGKPVPDPLNPTGDKQKAMMLLGGGIMSVAKVKPGQTYRWPLPVGKRLTFPGPGVYTVTCKRTVGLGGLGRGAPQLPLATTFTLTIHPYERQRMRRVIEGLAAEIRAAGHLEPRAVQRVLGRSAEITAQTRLHLAMSALAGIADEAAIGPLAEWTQSGDANIRSWGLRALTKFNAKRVEAVLIGALKDSSGVVRSQAARSLAGRRSGAAFAAIVQALDDDVPAVRKDAAHALGGVGLIDPNAAIETLARAARDADDAVRISAAGSLGRRLGAARPKAAAAVLLPLMDDRAAAVRREAGIALAMMGEKRAIPKLKKRIADDRITLANMLMKLGEPFDPRWITPLIRARKGNAWQGAIHFVRKHGGKRAAPALVRCLDFDKPTANYYNYTLCWQIAAAGGPSVTYHHDFDSDGTPDQIRHNAKVLNQLKTWAAKAPP